MSNCTFGKKDRYVQLIYYYFLRKYRPFNSNRTYSVKIGQIDVKLMLVHLLQGQHSRLKSKKGCKKCSFLYWITHPTTYLVECVIQKRYYLFIAIICQFQPSEVRGVYSLRRISIRENQFFCVNFRDIKLFCQGCDFFQYILNFQRTISYFSNISMHSEKNLRYYLFAKILLLAFKLVLKNFRKNNFVRTIF